jgi:hypothetical protein
MVDRLLAVAALAGAGFALAAAPAGAATGRLILQDGPAGPVTTLINPARGCYRMLTFTVITNHTDVRVTAYADVNCTGSAVTVPPGMSMPVETAQSLSVPA